jgi:hypothetical protein
MYGGYEHGIEQSKSVDMSSSVCFSFFLLEVLITKLFCHPSDLANLDLNSISRVRVFETSE